MSDVKIATILEHKPENDGKTVVRYKDDLPTKAATMQIIVSFLGSLSAISTGMGLGYPAITSQLLSSDDADIVLDSEQISWFASITAIACPVGGPISGYLTEKIGRRNTLMVTAVIAIASWLLIGFSSRDNVDTFFLELLIGRALIGITIGMITTPAITYCTEICHPTLRGRMTVLSTPFFVALGTLVVYLLGYLIPYDYRMVAFISAGFTIATLIILFFLPESPVYLITRNKTDQARKVLSLIRNLNKNDLRIDAEIERVKQGRNVSQSKHSFFDLFKEFGKPTLYKPFFIIVSFFAIQQLSGVFVLLVYAAQFSIEAGVTMDAFLCTVIIGVIRCFTTFLIAFASDKFGRRPMTIASGCGMFVSMLGITLCSAFPLNGGSFSWLPTLFLFLFIFTGTFGILTLPFAMVGEIYSQKTRSFASGITMSLAFLLSFAHIKMFSTIFEVFGNVAVFSFYTVIAFVGIGFAVFVLPETKGKTLQEIEQIFKKK